MAVRPIDASRFGEILEQWKKDCLEDNDTQGADIISDVILQLDDMPTLTQPNEGVKGKNVPANEPLTKAGLSALRPITREQVEKARGEWRSVHGLSEYYCSRCGEEFEIHSYDKNKYRFCPFCASPMTDEAVEMVVERLERLRDE